MDECYCDEILEAGHSDICEICEAEMDALVEKRWHDLFDYFDQLAEDTAELRDLETPGML